ncbi:MAG: hypothetical protein H7Y11_12720 [Armatimonadetes bacterium]|nr:hypothetical protein [Anaerolineae bacterium]
MEQVSFAWLVLSVIIIADAVAVVAIVWAGSQQNTHGDINESGSSKAVAKIYELYGVNQPSTDVKALQAEAAITEAVQMEVVTAVENDAAEVDLIIEEAVDAGAITPDEADAAQTVAAEVAANPPDPVNLVIAQAEMAEHAAEKAAEHPIEATTESATDPAPDSTPEPTAD